MPSTQCTAVTTLRLAPQSICACARHIKRDRAKSVQLGHLLAVPIEAIRWRKPCAVPIDVQDAMVRIPPSENIQDVAAPLQRHLKRPCVTTHWRACCHGLRVSSTHVHHHELRPMISLQHRCHGRHCKVVWRSLRYAVQIIKDFPQCAQTSMPRQVLPLEPAVDGFSEVHAMMLTGDYSCKCRAEFVERLACPAQPCQIDRIQRRREAHQ
mmetsp:Transcript_35461/g.81116  ORF Transcript_35461/g.81116 Transcript_35461/m.81116 type:complete len:210 (+) Transcript_35461:591-1220(+)